MRVLFLQLAAPSYEPADQRSNVPLAAGNLSAYASAALAGRGVEIETMPRDLLDRAGDAALLREILRRRPDAIAASLYCWSSHRTLDLLCRAREALPGLRAIVGGPEVDKGNEFLSSYAGRAFDWAASGEGEELFVQWIEFSLAGSGFDAIDGLGVVGPDGTMVWAPPRAPVRDLAKLPSPYLDGCLELRRAGIAHLETARGCVFECDFCFYHADFRKVRTFPRERVAKEIEGLLDAGVHDLYLMDPTFNGHSGYRETLRTLKRKLEARNAHVHTELIAEPMNAKNVAELVDSGITSVEVGLQTTTPDALAAVGRHFERTRFARGCRELTGAGIAVEIGTIVGLPKDTPDGMRATFLYARDECGEGTETVPFILSLLPATVLRSRASTFGIEYRRFPPYQIVRTPTFDDAGVRETLRTYSQIFESDLDPVPTIRLVESGGFEDPELQGGVPLRRAILTPSSAAQDVWSTSGARLADRVEANFCVIARKVACRDDVRALTAFLRPIRAANPHGLVEVALEIERPFDLPAAIAELRAALPPIEGHYLNEHLRFTAPPGADLSLRAALLLPVSSFGTWGRGLAECLPAIWTAQVARETDLLPLLEGPIELGALLLDPAPGLDIRRLVGIAGDDACDLRFRCSADQRAADEALGLPPHPPESIGILGGAGALRTILRDA
ncbi:MAG: radical SAM protein [Planctomycetes bacterium]|nr:radical SAM protein [Planctomycetota bacterium]